jgi:type I restriction enzyme, R subunit
VRESRGDDCINLKTKWAALEALVGDPKRLALIAADLVVHLTR